MILINRRRWHQPTIDYIARRRQDGKTTREANRCTCLAGLVLGAMLTAFCVQHDAGDR